MPGGQCGKGQPEMSVTESVDDAIAAAGRADDRQGIRQRWPKSHPFRLWGGQVGQQRPGGTVHKGEPPRIGAPMEAAELDRPGRPQPPCHGRQIDAKTYRNRPAVIAATSPPRIRHDIRARYRAECGRQPDVPEDGTMPRRRSQPDRHRPLLRAHSAGFRRDRDIAARSARSVTASRAPLPLRAAGPASPTDRRYGPHRGKARPALARSSSPARVRSFRQE